MSRSVNKNVPEYNDHSRSSHQENRGPRYGNLRRQMAELKVIRRRNERAKNKEQFLKEMACAQSLISSSC